MLASAKMLIELTAITTAGNINAFLEPLMQRACSLPQHFDLLRWLQGHTTEQLLHSCNKAATAVVVQVLLVQAVVVMKLQLV